MNVFSVRRLSFLGEQQSSSDCIVEFDCSGEALIFDTEGVPQHG